ncbi:MAG: rubrerythrin family protein [Phycisphaerae bacterium]|jgi:hypothetical protein
MLAEKCPIMDQATKLELNVSKLYLVFSRICTEDADFWWQLSIEETNHAALLESVRETAFKIDLFADSQEEHKQLAEANEKIASMIKKFEQTPATREQAFNIALELENSAGEIHFQHFIEKREKTPTEKVFETLNQEDSDHAERIRSYMDCHGIAIIS